MPFTRLHKRITAWIAMFAILLAALAPSVSHALAASKGGTAWTEICSVNGIKLVKSDQEVPAQGKHVAGFEHCPFCSSHANHLALPASAAIVFSINDGRVSHPPLFYQAPRPLFIWAGSQSRAPPFHS